MEYDYFEERFIEEHFQEEIINRNTSRIDYLENHFMKKQWKKDYLWVQDNLKKLNIKRTLNKYQKSTLINTSTDYLKTAEGI